jgi:hypothetical protein
MKWKLQNIIGKLMLIAMTSLYAEVINIDM